jgi:hypothetical protein
LQKALDAIAPSATIQALPRVVVGGNPVFGSLVTNIGNVEIEGQLFIVHSDAGAAIIELLEIIL